MSNNIRKIMMEQAELLESICTQTNYNNDEAINYLKSLEVEDVQCLDYYIDDSCECAEYRIDYKDGTSQKVDIMWNETYNPPIRILFHDYEFDTTDFANILYNWLDNDIDRILEDIDAETEAEFRAELVNKQYHPQVIEMLIKEYNETKIEA